jgi:putative phosphoesterase
VTIIGIISDTHGLLRPETLDELSDSDLIVHAGDIGCMEIIHQLSSIASVSAIRGNIDKGEWASVFPEEDVVAVAGKYIYLIHNLGEINLDPAAAEFDLVVSGHTHRPLIEKKDGVLYVNPGSAGPRRFTLPVALAKAHITSEGVTAEITEIEI